MTDAPAPRRIPDATGRTRAILDLAIRLAMLQLGSGAGAADATGTMTGVCRAYGLRGTDADVTHTLVTLTWTNLATDESLTRRHVLPRRGLDYHRLAAAADLYDQITSRRIDLVTARRRLARVTAGKALVRPTLRRVGWGLVGAGAAILLGGDALVAVVAAAAAFLLDTLTSTLAARGVPLLFQTLIGGMIGPIAAVLVHLVSPAASASLIVVATIVVLLAGVTVFGGVQDILTAFYITGIARLTEGVVATTGLAAGVIATSAVLGRVSAPLPVSGHEALPAASPLVGGVAAVVMVFGFALGAQLPWRALWCVCVLGVVAELAFLGCTAAAIPEVGASAIAAVAVGMIASTLTRLVRVPVLALIVSAVVPLLPGLLLFNGMMQVAQSSVGGLMDVIRAAAVAGALAAGAIFGHYLVRLIRGQSRVLRLGKL